MRRWPMSTAPKDGSVIIGCTRVEGVEYRMRWVREEEAIGWREDPSGRRLPEDLFVEWRRDRGAE